MKRFLCLASGGLALGLTLSSRALGQSLADEGAPPEPTGSEQAGSEQAAAEQTAATEGAPAPAPPKAVAGPLLLRVEGTFDEASRDALKEALVAELGCLVLVPGDAAAFAFRGTIDVRTDETGKVLSVRYEDDAHEVTERQLESPESPEDRERMVVFVVGSLARGAARETEPVQPNATAEASSQRKPDAPLEKQFAHASLYYPIATNYGKPDIHTHFGFNLVYGRVGLLEGLSFGTYQVATKGVQGLEFALAANVTFGKAEGVQAASVTNVAQDVEGAQLAFGVNVARDLQGAQGALGANVARDVKGAQGALGANVAEDVDGGQVGFVNVAKKVRGVQLGIVNFSDEIEGVPIGLVSVAKKGGGVHPLVWYSNHSYVNLGLKFATRYTYTFVNLAWNTDDYLIGPGFGIGGTVPVWKERLFVDADLSETMLMPENGAPAGTLAERSQYLSRFRVLARYQFFKHLGVFAGGGLAVSVERGIDESTGQWGDFAATTRGELSAGVQF